MTIPRQGVHTASELQRSRRLLDRRRHAAEHIISAMRHGASLHLHYENGRPLWWSSTGASLSTTALIRQAIAHPSVLGPVVATAYSPAPQARATAGSTIWHPII